MLQSPLKAEWKQSLFENYGKNHRFGLFSKLFPKSNLPEGIHVHKPTIGFKVKPTYIDNYYNLSSRICLNSALMIKGIYFNKSYSPVIHVDTLCLIIAIGSSNKYIFLLGDIMNSFQQTIDIKECLYINLLPFYHQ